MSGVDPASFRDPEAAVFLHDGRLLRGLSERAAEAYRAAHSAGLIPQLVERGLLIEHWEASPPASMPDGVPSALVLEARRLPVRKKTSTTSACRSRPFRKAICETGWNRTVSKSVISRCVTAPRPSAHPFTSVIRTTISSN